jgi:F420-non-reducing hydrogenase small subunit
MTDKKKFAFYWGAACGGCEVTVLDTDAAILDVAALADIVLWPLAADGKYADVEAMPDDFIDVCFFNGGVRNTETEHIARLLRAKSKVVVSLGACACSGGLPGMANQFDRESIMSRVYQTSESTINADGRRPQAVSVVPEGELDIPTLYERVYPLDEIISVDYYLPGCPPTSAWVVEAIKAIATDSLPPPGSVIGLTKTLCDECPRVRSSKRSITQFHRPHEIIPDPVQCLLEQGIVCCGPATRGGCGARCVAVNMPCRGCYGPPEGTRDQGAKMLSAVASLIAADDEEEIERIAGQLGDPIGSLCPFSLPKSLLSQALRRSK